MALLFRQEGYDLILEEDIGAVPPQFTRGALVSVELTDDTFTSVDDLSLNFVPDDGRKHDPARVELIPTDETGMYYAGKIGKAALIVSGLNLVALGGIDTATGEVITSIATPILINRSVDPEAVPVPDSESLAGFIRTAIDGYAGEHGITTGATAEEAAQIQQNAAAVTSLKLSLIHISEPTRPY